MNRLNKLEVFIMKDSSERLLCTKIVWLRLSMTVTGWQMDFP